MISLKINESKIEVLKKKLSSVKWKYLPDLWFHSMSVNKVNFPLSYKLFVKAFIICITESPLKIFNNQLIDCANELPRVVREQTWVSYLVKQLPYFFILFSRQHFLAWDKQYPFLWKLPHVQFFSSKRWLIHHLIMK